MSARAIERALARLAASPCVLAPERTGESYGLYLRGDRRRRPVVRLTHAEVRALEASGAICDVGDDAFAITEAGRARVRREAADSHEAFAAQHRPVIDRVVMDGDGVQGSARGHETDPVSRRLAALRDGAGAPWLSAAELAAAVRLRADWEAAQRGLVRGLDWSAPPGGASTRASGNGREIAMAVRCDARRAMADALERLAPPLRRVVERVCLKEEGLEMLERAEAWPARSGKIALKLALAQLAAS